MRKYFLIHREKKHGASVSHARVPRQPVEREKCFVSPAARNSFGGGAHSRLVPFFNVCIWRENRASFRLSIRPGAFFVPALITALNYEWEDRTPTRGALLLMIGHGGGGGRLVYQNHCTRSIINSKKGVGPFTRDTNNTRAEALYFCLDQSLARLNRFEQEFIGCLVTMVDRLWVYHTCT